jgi:hypothetical protein
VCKEEVIKGEKAEKRKVEGKRGRRDGDRKGRVSKKM